MLCALTVRTLKAGTFERFRDAFMAHENLEDPPAGYVRFNMVRNTESSCDEVIRFGLFDGTAVQLRRTAAEQLKAIAPFVESVGADGLYEVVEEQGSRDGSCRDLTEVWRRAADRSEIPAIWGVHGLRGHRATSAATDLRILVGATSR